MNPYFTNFNQTEFFEDFLHMFLNHSSNETSLHSSYNEADGSFKIVEWNGSDCTNVAVFDELRNKVVKYGYTLDNDNVIRPNKMGA